MSKILQIEMADDVFVAMQKEPAEFSSELRLAAAVKWYELGTISQDEAAEIAGLSRSAFIAAMTRFEVSPFQETAAEIVQAVKEQK
ncbi:MAG: UPF0175 family protein [Kiritimatiellae bacterium]|nr:UPF0175 family protein [Kiritimatiellia bacterium]